MNPLARLSARIAELEQARSELESALVGLEAAPPPPPTVDWESRLSAAKAVDVLTGANTTQALEQARADEQRRVERQGKEAVQNAARATQAREALDTLTRDIEAAESLLRRELTATANSRLADCESDYHRTRAAMLNAAESLAGCLALAGQETAAAQLLRSIGVAGDPLSLMNRRANELREQLLNQEEPKHA